MGTPGCGGVFGHCFGFFFPFFSQNLVVVIQVHFLFFFFGYITLSRFGLCEF